MDLTAVCKTAASGKWVRSPPHSPYKSTLLNLLEKVLETTSSVGMWNLVVCFYMIYGSVVSTV